MAQRKLRPFAQIVKLVGELTNEQKLDLFDLLRGTPEKKEPKASKKPEKVEKTEKTAKVDMCAICGNEKTFVDHQESSPDYHVFRTSLKQKAGTG